VRKLNIVLFALTLIAAVAFAQSKPASPATAQTPAPSVPSAPTAAPATSADADPVIVSAGTVTIRRSDFEAAVKTLPAEYQTFAMGPGKKQFADDYLRMKLLAAEGMKNNLDKSPEVTKQLELMRENLVATEELKKIESTVTVTDAELKKAYDDNKKDYEQVKARHILIAFKGSPAAQKSKKQLTDAEAKAKAEELRKKLVAGADFAEMAKKESDDVESGKNGGDLGAFGHGQMVPEFEKAAFNAKPGEITPVVKTQFGYHIIKVEEKISTPFDTVKASLEKTIRQKKVHDLLDAMKTAAKPTFNDAYFATPAAPAAAAEKKQ
jgi:peptidyl-prolyl cis-trans isomerase C